MPYVDAWELEGYFSSPQDNPPTYLAMIYAYIDETGHETDDWMFLAGYLGTEDQWKCLASKWAEAFGPQRKHLHMKELRFKKDRERRLLERLGPIPLECGLKRLIGGVKVSDFADLLVATPLEKLIRGYVICLTPLVIHAALSIPSGERIEFVFENQFQYEDAVNRYFRIALNNPNHNPLHLILMHNPDGSNKIAKWSFVPKGSTSLTEPADYLAYAVLQSQRAPGSLKAQWCAPILAGGELYPDGRNFIGRIFTREEVRNAVISGGNQVAIPQLVKRGIPMANEINTNQQPQSDALADVKVTEDAQFRRIYANNVLHVTTLFDFRLIFGFHHPTTPSSPPRLEQQAELVLSPQLAKVLSITLSAALVQYEKAYGLINLPNMMPLAAQQGGQK